MSSLPLKVCGLTRAVDVQNCLDCGARFTGFIFAPESPRYISPEAAAELPKGEACRVGVFAGQSADEVLRIMKLARLDYAQLHGGEDEQFCRIIGQERVIKVFWPQVFSSLDLLQAACNSFAGVCAFFLIDAGKHGGGSGKCLLWEDLRGFNPPRPWILAGGLGPDTLEDAIQACSVEGSSVSFCAVDCNSGLEDAPGIKNIDKLKSVAAILRKAVDNNSISGCIQTKRNKI
jgi:phosphoribosylanthranilate isomerase